MYAIINDYKIIEIREVSDEEMPGLAGRNQHVIEYSTFARPPAVGWIYEKGLCYPNIQPVTPRQIRQAWILMGKQLSEIDDAINLLPEPNRSLAKAEWEYSTLVLRTNNLVNMLGQMQGYSADDLDALWIFAGNIK